jgi:hypothetical protein
MNRIPVRYQGLPLMPMKQTKAFWLVKNHKAKFRFNRKLNLWYLKLLVSPSGYLTQEIVLGIDPGSTFDGYSLLSKLFHHLNIEYIQRPKKGKNSIKSFKQRQSMNRRVRRCRLRHRPIRFDNRMSSKLPPTIQANVNSRKWIIEQLMKYFPFTKIRIEDVKFNHFRDLVGKNRLNGKARGAAFSLVEVGKQELYNWIIASGFKLELIEGYETHKMRLEYLKGSDTKSLDKSEKSFNAHCLDSFIIASQDLNRNLIALNSKTVFIEKIVKQRRALTRIRAKYKDLSKYFRYAVGGEKVFSTNISRKKNICRVKIDGEHSNHPKQWVYLDNGFAEKINLTLLDMVEPVSMESKNFSKTTNGLIEIYRCVKIYIDGHTPS